MQTLRKKTSPCKYKNEPSRFLGDGVSFRAKLIGILEVGEARGERMCQEALADLKMAVRAAGEHKQRIVVCVAIDGLRLRDDKTGDCLYHHPVHKISFIAQDMTDSRAFGYIFGSPDTGHRFFGIKTDKAASQVVIAMRDLFQVVFELKKKEIEMAKQHIEQQQQLKYSSKYSDLSSKESGDQGKMRTIEEDQGESCSSGGRGRRHTSSTAAVVAISPPPRHPNALQHQHHTSEVIADLLDLEIELSSIQAGIHQMEKMTPSDPFGPGATTPSAVSSLHIPPIPSHLSPTVSVEDPFGDSFVGPSAAAISLTSSSSLSMQASKRQALTEPSMGNTSADTSWFEKPLGSEDLFAEVGEAGAGREQENQNGGVGQLSDSGKAEERIMSAQFDVFTELDPLGTGRSRPYIDKKDFFQDLKNPPKKVLRDLVTDTPCTHSVTPPAFPATIPLFNAMFDDTSQPAFFPPSFPAPSDLFTESVFPSAADASAASVAPSPPLAAEDPFADTDPFVSAPSAVSLSDVDVSGIFPRIEDDPFDTDFANLSSSRKKRVDSATVGRKPRKGITHGPLRVSLPPEKKSLDSPVLLPPPPTGTGTIPRSRSRSPRSLAPITRTSPQSPPEPPPRPDSAAKPPPLPPKRVSIPSSRQAEDASQYEFIDQYETSPRAAVESKTIPRSIRKSGLPPPPRRQHQRVSPSAETEAPKRTVAVPTEVESTPPPTSFDLTLAELGKMSIADLASALCIPPERVSTMTLQELAEKLSTCRTKSASDKEEEYAKRDRYAALRESLDDEFAPTAATFSADFEAKFEEEFNKENEPKDDVFPEVSSFDKYAVFRELIDSEAEKDGTPAVEATREESPQNEASDASKEGREEEEKAKEEEEESSREETAEDKYAALREICVEEEKGEEEAGGAAETNSSEERNEKVEEETGDLVVLSREEGIAESGGGTVEGKGEEWAKENVGWANFTEKATDGGDSEEAASPWSSESREAVGWEGAWGSEGKADYGSRSEAKRGCRWRRSEEEEEEDRRRPRRSRKAAWVEEEGRRRCWEEGARRRQRVRKPSTWGDEEDEGEEEEEWEEEDWRGKKRRPRRRSVEWDAEEEEEERSGRRPLRRREGTWDRRGKSYRSWDEEDEAEEDYEEEGSRRCRRVRTASGEGSSRTTSRHFRHEQEEFGRERGRELGHRRRTTPTPSSFGQRKTGPHRWQQRREEEEGEEERWGRRSGARRGRQRGKEAPIGKRTTSRGSSGGRLQSPFEDDFVHGTGGGGSSVSSDVSERSPVVHNGRCSDDVFLPCDASSVDTFPETTTQRPFSAPVEGARNRMERPRGGTRGSGLISSTSHRMQRQQSSELGGLRKSESVNIFARDSDPFDDDFFSSGNAGRGQSADPFKWTEPFGQFREEEEDDEEGERVPAAGQAD